MALAVGILGGMFVLTGATTAQAVYCETVKVPPKWAWWQCLSVMPGTGSNPYCYPTYKRVCS